MAAPQGRNRPPADAVLHLTLEEQWTNALNSGEYRLSTRTKTVDEIGFIHCSFPDQIARMANLHYPDVPQIIVLRIDPDRCPAAPLRVEEAEGQLPGQFPHLYGPVPVKAVVETWQWHSLDGRFRTHDLWH